MAAPRKGAEDAVGHREDDDDGKADFIRQEPPSLSNFVNIYRDATDIMILPDAVFVADDGPPPLASSSFCCAEDQGLVGSSPNDVQGSEEEEGRDGPEDNLSCLTRKMLELAYVGLRKGKMPRQQLQEICDANPTLYGNEIFQDIFPCVCGLALARFMQAGGVTDNGEVLDPKAEDLIWVNPSGKNGVQIAHERRGR